MRGVCGVTLVVGHAPMALGCAVCFGAPDAAQTQGANAAILTLLCVLLVVGCGVAGLVGRIILSARAGGGVR